MKTWGSGVRIYQQSVAYTHVLNSGLRTCEALGLLNSDEDLERWAIHLRQGVKLPDGAIKSLSPRQEADPLCRSTSEITELYYVWKDTARLGGITAGFRNEIASVFC